MSILDHGDFGFAMEIADEVLAQTFQAPPQGMAPFQVAQFRSDLFSGILNLAVTLTSLTSRRENNGSCTVTLTFRVGPTRDGGLFVTGFMLGDTWQTATYYPGHGFAVRGRAVLDLTLRADGLRAVVDFPAGSADPLDATFIEVDQQSLDGVFLHPLVSKRWPARG